jgi:hypothetical protein
MVVEDIVFLLCFGKFSCFGTWFVLKTVCFDSVLVCFQVLEHGCWCAKARAMDCLAKVLRASGARVVLSSAWRTFPGAVSSQYNKPIYEQSRWNKQLLFVVVVVVVAVVVVPIVLACWFPFVYCLLAEP